MNNLLYFLSISILVYFIVISLFYLTIFLLSFMGLVSHQIRAGFATTNEILKAKITPPVSILSPAYNEELSIVASVNSLLTLIYENLEVIVINDASTDKTLDKLKEAFKLKQTARKYNHQIPTKNVKAIYRSQTIKELIVIDKENGGKADSLNAGINICSYPLFCCIDADSVLEKQSLLRMVLPFMEAYSSTVATGGLIRIANGCTYREDYPMEVATSKKWIVNFQIVEYFRAFLAGRMGLNLLNCNMVISGAFGLFKKQPVIDVGGYRNDLVGEDMELVVRLHHELRKDKKPCGIYFIPDTVCWTEAPESYKTLARQRNRWQRGLAESLFCHITMLFNPRYKTVGLIAMPYFVFVEFLSPIIELIGYVIFIIGFFTGAVNLFTFTTFFLLAVIFGLALSLLALMMEEVIFHRYPKVKDLLRLMAAAVLENFGYRQYMAIIRAMGLLDWIRGRKSWGKMERVGSVG